MQEHATDRIESLELRLEAQAAELHRLGRLKRFFSPQLAEAIVSGRADLLASHRRDVSVVFLDLRGFTAFSERARPEEVMDMLREFHRRMGPLILAQEGTLERFTGDGMMVFFNDPVEVPNPEERAVRMVLAMRGEAERLRHRWRLRGHDLDLGIGIAAGEATLGAIGFEGRHDYAAVGRATNLAARLCAEAPPGQVLLCERVAAAVDSIVETEPHGVLRLKGIRQPVPARRLLGPRTRATA